MFFDSELEKAHKKSMLNREKLEESDFCACFNCLETFPFKSINEWVDQNDSTALCPKCGIDSVLGSAQGFDLSKEFLLKMNQRWFG